MSKLIRHFTASAGLALASMASTAVALEAPGSLADEIHIGRFSGVLLLAEPGQPLRVESGGRADLAGSPNSADLAYPIGSISKPLTAILVLRLMELGKLELDDPVERHLPQLAGKPLAKVTLRQLLSHSGGIRSLYQSGAGAVEEKFDPAELALPTTLDAQIARFADAGLLFEPGSRYSYSNSGYMLLARIAEQASGRSYAEALRRHVLKPAGMTAACQCNDVPGVADAQALELQADSVVPAQALDASRGTGAGGVRATPRALLALASALHAGRLLKPATLELMWKAVVPTGKPGESYALGWVVRERAGVRVVEHDGAVPGSLAWLALEPSSGRIGVIALNQTLPLEQLDFSSTYLRNRFRLEFDGASADHSGLAPALARQATLQLAGSWQLGADRGFEIAPAGSAGWSLSIGASWTPQELAKLRPLQDPAVADDLALFEAWSSGRHADVSQQFDAQMQSALPAAAQAATWQQLVAQFGAYREHWVHGHDAARGQAQLRLRFASGAVDLSVIRNGAGKVVGLRMDGQQPDVAGRRFALWPTRDGALWLDGYRLGLPDQLLQPRLDRAGRATSISMDAAGHWVARR